MEENNNNKNKRKDLLIFEDDEHEETSTDIKPIKEESEKVKKTKQEAIDEITSYLIEPLSPLPFEEENHFHSNHNNNNNNNNHPNESEVVHQGKMEKKETPQSNVLSFVPWRWISKEMLDECMSFSLKLFPTEMGATILKPIFSYEKLKNFMTKEAEKKGEKFDITFSLPPKQQNVFYTNFPFCEMPFGYSPVFDQKNRKFSCSLRLNFDGSESGKEYEEKMTIFDEWMLDQIIKRSKFELERIEKKENIPENSTWLIPDYPASVAKKIPLEALKDYEKSVFQSSYRSFVRKSSKREEYKDKAYFSFKLKTIPGSKEKKIPPDPTTAFLQVHDSDWKPLNDMIEDEKGNKIRSEMIYKHNSCNYIKSENTTEEINKYMDLKVPSLTGTQEHRPLIPKNSFCAGVVYFEQLSFVNKGVGPTFVATNIAVKKTDYESENHAQQQLQQLKNYS